MKKLITLIVVIAALLLLAFTCPNKQAHQDKIKTTMSNLVDEKLNKEASEGKIQYQNATKTRSHCRSRISVF